jgi:AraC-like DNA-binding protein
MMENKEDFEYKLQDTIDQLNTIAYHLGFDQRAAVIKHSAVLLQMQSERIEELESAYNDEHDERLRMERAIFRTRQTLAVVSDELNYSRPVRQEPAVDTAPYRNVMAYHGVDPYAKKKRTPKA